MFAQYSTPCRLSLWNLALCASISWLDSHLGHCNLCNLLQYLCEPNRPRSNCLEILHCVRCCLGGNVLHCIFHLPRNPRTHFGTNDLHLRPRGRKCTAASRDKGACSQHVSWYRFCHGWQGTHDKCCDPSGEGVSERYFAESNRSDYLVVFQDVSRDSGSRRREIGRRVYQSYIALFYNEKHYTKWHILSEHSASHTLFC